MFLILRKLYYRVCSLKNVQIILRRLKIEMSFKCSKQFSMLTEKKFVKFFNKIINLLAKKGIEDLCLRLKFVRNFFAFQE